MRRVLRAIWAILSAPFRFVWWVVRRIADWLRAVYRDFSAFFIEEPEDTPVADAISKAVDNPQDILLHLGALRKHLIRATLFLAVATAVSFAFTQQILEILASPLGGGLDALQAIDVTEPIGVFMRVALLSGFSVSLPYIILELWLFAAPGLSRRARLMGLLAIPAVTLFFLAGMLFAYLVMLPTALPFLLDFMGFRTEPRPATYFPFVTNLMFWVGIAFQFPLVIFVLASLGLVEARMLLRQSRLAIVIMALVAAMITPTVDPINMFLVWGPLVGLYYLGVGLAFLAQRRRPAAEQQTRVPGEGSP
jgi:sec-independent protein translocase protein TatC